MKRPRIKQSIYRILMSEMLPYELPLFMSNNRFYQIADKLRLALQDDHLIYRRNLSKKQQEKEWADCFVKLLNGTGRKSSFNYYINKHDGTKSRELVLVHPLMQMRVLELYRKYDSLIFNFCSKSNFSLRFPDKRATFFSPKKSPSKAVEDMLDYKANENPKHYFHYRKYQNINSFYDGKEFQRMESRFKYMYKADIHHCFDMIPIMELSQMLYKTDNKNIGSDNFGSIFSLLMQEMNYGRDTINPMQEKGVSKHSMMNSVLIGPEFSRIFAEMFLQQIDVNIETRLATGYESYIVHRDYECFRYVDDIFFFYNEQDVYNKFYGILVSELRNHGRMKLNGKDKSYIEHIPVIKGLSIAKRELRLVVEKLFENRLETVEGLILRQNQNYYDFPLNMKVKYTIIDIKTIISRNEVGLNEVSASMLAHLHRRLGKSLDSIDSLMNDYRQANSEGLLDYKGKQIWHRYENGLVYYLREMIKLLFYIFNNDMRMNTSIRVLSILNMMLTFCQGTLFQENTSTSRAMSEDAKNIIYKSIVDELIFILKHNQMYALNGLEISNLMLTLLSIPGSYRIDTNIWKQFIGNAFSPYSKDGDTNFLVALTLLMIFGHDVSNRTLHEDICIWLCNDLREHDWDVDDVECLMIMLSMMTAPYVDRCYKQEILQHVDEKFRKPLEIISHGKSPFTQWEDFKLTKACQMKYSAEVY